MLLSRYFNVSTTILGANGVFTSGALHVAEGSPITIAAGGQTAFPAQVYSTTEAVGVFKYFNAICISDQVSAASGFIIQMSPDQGTTWRTVASATIAANTLSALTVLIAFPGSLYRVQLTNAATPQTYLILGASVTVT